MQIYNIPVKETNAEKDNLWYITHYDTISNLDNV